MSKPKAKFRVGQVVHVRDWKETERIGRIAKKLGDLQYYVEWSLTERICVLENEIRPLTTKERGPK